MPLRDLWGYISWALKPRSKRLVMETSLVEKSVKRSSDHSCERCSHNQGEVDDVSSCTESSLSDLEQMEREHGDLQVGDPREPVTLRLVSTPLSPRKPSCMSLSALFTSYHSHWLLCLSTQGEEMSYTPPGIWHVVGIRKHFFKKVAEHESGAVGCVDINVDAKGLSCC